MDRSRHQHPYMRYTRAGGAWTAAGRDIRVLVTGGRERKLESTGDRERMLESTGGRELKLESTGGRERKLESMGGREHTDRSRRAGGGSTCTNVE